MSLFIYKEEQAGDTTERALSANCTNLSQNDSGNLSTDTYFTGSNSEFKDAIRWNGQAFNFTILPFSFQH